MIRIFHFDLAYTKGWSGGDNCTFETIRYFTQKPVENIHITTERCRAVYEQKGLTESDNLRFITVPDFCREPDGLKLFAAYFRRIRAVLPLLKKIEWRNDDAVLLHNDFFVNTIPSRIPHRKNSAVRMFYWIHMVSPDLFKGFNGQFTNTHKFPDPAFAHFWLSQRLCAKLMAPNGIVISHNPYYAELMPRLFPERDYRLIYPYSGVDKAFRETAPSETFEYDCIWLGRFHQQKGLFDLIETVDAMRKERPGIRVAVIGGGNARIEQKVQQQIRKRNLEQNMILLGPLFDAEKFKTLRKAKLYLMTSHFEGYCNVMVEALTMGLPVVAFDAPFHQVFDQGVVKVPMRDATALAREALALLDNEPRRKGLAQAAFEAGNRHTWEHVAEETYRILTSHLPRN